MRNWPAVYLPPVVSSIFLYSATPSAFRPISISVFARRGTEFFASSEFGKARCRRANASCDFSMFFSAV